MSFLSTRGDTAVYDSQLNNAQTVNNTYNFANVTEQSPFHILQRHVALGALFDSDARFDPPKCHPETRTAVLDHIRRWAEDSNSPPILWIRGAAGAGKSAIAQTLSEGWDEEGSLAASFYFSRTIAGRNVKLHLIATLAYQLTTAVPATRSHIEAAIQREPGIFDRNLRTQIKRLLVNPLLSISGGVPLTTRFVVIDGLDECCVDMSNENHEQQQKEILEALQFALNHPGFPLRFLVASRPERQIRETFEHGPLSSISTRIILDDTQNPSADIELYLRCKLAEIRKTHPYLGSSWPPEGTISRLVEKSSGHFIYIAVVVRYLSSPRMNPEAGLKAVMEASHDQSRDSPFADLDALYTHILESVVPRSLPTVTDVFGLLICSRMHEGWCLFDSLESGNAGVQGVSPLWLSKFLFTSLGELLLHLIDLHSILHIPVLERSSQDPVKFLHASFSEFLSEPSRSGKFYIDREQQSLHILSLSIRHLFIQMLSPYNGRSEQYNPNGFACMTIYALQREKIINDEIVDGLRALVNQDEDEFCRYVCGHSLGGSINTRESTDVLHFLYDPSAWYDGTEQDGGVVLATLKKYPKEGFMPVDPAIFWPDKYEKGLYRARHSGLDKNPIPHDSEESEPRRPTPANTPPFQQVAEISEGTHTPGPERQHPGGLPSAKRRLGFRTRISKFISRSSSNGDSKKP